MQYTDPYYLQLLWIIPAFIIVIALLQKKKSIKTWLALFSRSGVLVALIIALANPYLEDRKKSLEVPVLVDISDSINPKDVDTLLGPLENFQKEGFQFRFYPFAESVAPFSSHRQSFQKMKSSWSALNTGKSDLEEALKKHSGSPAVFLISDGHETSGNVIRFLEKGREKNSKVYPFAPFDRKTDDSELPEILQTIAPVLVDGREEFDVTVTIRNPLVKDQEVKLFLAEGSEVLAQEQVFLRSKEEKVIPVTASFSEGGIHQLSVRLEGEAEDILDEDQVFVTVREKEKLLVLSGSQIDARGFVRDLSDEQYRIESYVPGDSGFETALPDQHSVVVLNNIPHQKLPSGFPQGAEAFVESGGGLLVTGGNKSFGLGGYLNTKIAELFPLEPLPPQTEKKRLNLAVALILDKSRSMATGGKIDFAREAAREVIKFLKDEDYIGVVGFDFTPFVVVKMGKLQQTREQALRRIDRLFAAGRTMLYPAMDEGRRSLARVQAGRKHMIILTDGKIPPGPDYLRSVERMKDAGITVSTVMLGSEVDVRLLREMAERGGGAFYRTTSAQSLPRLFIKDIKVTTGERTLQEQKEFFVRKIQQNSPIVSLDRFPELLGYVKTQLRPEAVGSLNIQGREGDEPLMAYWSRGEGRVVAFSSDVNGRWSRYWTGWPKYRQFWTDALRWLREKKLSDDQIDFDLRHYYDHGSLMLELSIFSEFDGDLSANVLQADGKKSSPLITRLKRGLYSIEIPEAIAGKYEVKFQSENKKFPPVAVYLSGELLGEQKGKGFHYSLLQKLASRSGGKLNPEVQDLQQQMIEQVTRNNLRWLALLLALLLFCCELIVREK